MAGGIRPGRSSSSPVISLITIQIRRIDGRRSFTRMGWLSHWHLQTGVLGNDGKNRDVSKRGLYCHSLGCWHRKRLCIHTANTLVCAPGRSASRPDGLAKRDVELVAYSARRLAVDGTAQPVAAHGVAARIRSWCAAPMASASWRLTAVARMLPYEMKTIVHICGPGRAHAMRGACS